MRKYILSLVCILTMIGYNIYGQTCTPLMSIPNSPTNPCFFIPCADFSRVYLDDASTNYCYKSEFYAIGVAGNDYQVYGYTNPAYTEPIVKVVSGSIILLDRTAGDTDAGGYFVPSDIDDCYSFLEFVVGDCFESGTSLDECSRRENIDESKTPSIATIFPNPSVDGQFTIGLNDESTAQATVVNTIGQTVKSSALQSGNTIHLDLGSEAAGIYIVKVIQNGVSNSYKVVSNK